MEGKFGVFPLSEVTSRSLYSVTLDQFPDSPKPLCARFSLWLNLGNCVYVLEDFPRKGNCNMLITLRQSKKRSQRQLQAGILCPKAVAPAGQSSLPKQLCFHCCGTVLPEQPGSMENHGSVMWMGGYSPFKEALSVTLVNGHTMSKGL